MRSHSLTPLPPPRPNQHYVTISPINGGSITLPDHCFVTPADPDAKRTVPSLSFLIAHPGSTDTGNDAWNGRPLKLLFDLGLRSRKDRYLPLQQKHLESRAPYGLSGVAERLSKGGVEPRDVDIIFLSHVHYDHHGDPEDFLRSTFIVGPGSLDVLKHGVGGIGSHQHFQGDLLPVDRTVQLPPASNGGSSRPAAGALWKPLGPFPAALDLLDDGSMYVVDTPGHLPGHINLLCRTAVDRWVCLAGDSFHDPRLLTGEKDIGTWDDGQGHQLCIHLDPVAAKASIERLRQLENMGNVEVIAAHDDGWAEKHSGVFFPSSM
ncbi:hypothetical protein LTR04_003396 [Oleoguttula sp. CCFEE 6159]|nr:hypothetical protein LTR04_003396 [Oleoguttula sp. CCFEE 6159]